MWTAIRLLGASIRLLGTAIRLCYIWNTYYKPDSICEPTKTKRHIRKITGIFGSDFRAKKTVKEPQKTSVEGKSYLKMV